MSWLDGGGGLGGRVQFLQAQLFPVFPSQGGILGSFLSKGLKTNQLEVNTDERTLRPIARLKEPRDLFALPKDKDHDCPQQAARWPIECQVLEERVRHIENVSCLPEPYNQPSGNELKPRPVGEENGIVVYNYNPVSAVNYNKKICDYSDVDSDISSSESRGSSPDRGTSKKVAKRFTKKFISRSSSNSNDEDFVESDERESLQESSDEAENCEDCEPQTINDKEIRNTEFTAQVEFSRSSVSGSKFLTNVCTFNPEEYTGLEFESRFESGNLSKAVQISSTYYELYLRPDLYTNRSKQWFYFRVTKTKHNVTYRFSIVNLVKSDSLYNDGMRPLMYSTINAKTDRLGWRRCGENICYYRNEEEGNGNGDEDDENSSYTLTFNITFDNDDDTVYFAHSYPYTYSDLQDYLMEIQKHPIKSKFSKLRLLCRSLAGNNVYYLTVTAPTTDEELAKKKRAIVISARVHPGETPSSWMMKGLMDYITGDSPTAKRLRHKFIFKLIPMLNPDGVIVGNSRYSLAGKDLNRQYRTVIREAYPSIWYTKAMIKRLIDECGVALYCDMHAHSRKHNVFVYGCENKRGSDKKLTEQVLPLMVHKNVADKFCFESCKFKVQRNKEGTGRIVIWMLNVTNSYTIEASFGGSSLGSRKGTHFSTADYEHMGRAFCETLLDYYDDTPNKERLRLKIIERLLREGSSADEPLNIPLSDYSSDEGTSSSSDNEEKCEPSDLEGPCCYPLKAPPCSPEMTAASFDTRKTKKLKFRCKSSHIHKRNKNRKALDMPCTDPTSDIHFSTDDELYGNTTDGYDTVPRSRRTLLKSELQRRYIEQFAVGNGDGDHKMPPELIVTKANQTGSDSTKDNLHDFENKYVADSLHVRLSEFPPLSGCSAVRTNSWHDLNASKPGRQSKVQRNKNLYTMTSNAESLQMKLSLKKKIWTGVAPDGALSFDRSRPLSWGMPPITKKKEPNKYCDVLLSECSQKLMAWQQEVGLMLTRNKPLEPIKNKAMYNLIDPDLLQDKCAAKLKTNAKVPFKFDKRETGNSEPKIKKKKTPLNKVSDTTQNVNCIANPKTKAATKGTRKTNAISNNGPSLLTAVPAVPAVPAVTNNVTTFTKSQKFKTGGLVATAVQPSKKTKRLRSLTAMKPTNHIINTPITTDHSTTNAQISPNYDKEHNIVRKVKTKLKKKK